MTGDEGRSTCLFPIQAAVAFNPLEEVALQSRGKAVTCEGIESVSDIVIAVMLPFLPVFFRGELLSPDVCK